MATSPIVRIKGNAMLLIGKPKLRASNFGMDEHNPSVVCLTQTIQWSGQVFATHLHTQCCQPPPGATKASHADT